MKAIDFLNQPIPEPNYIKRVSKELARFTNAIEGINKNQAKEVIGLLRLVLAAIDEMGKAKSVVPIMDPVKIDITDNSPTEWEFNITRDRIGLISKVTAKAVD